LQQSKKHHIQSASTDQTCGKAYLLKAGRTSGGHLTAWRRQKIWAIVFFPTQSRRDYDPLGESIDTEMESTPQADDMEDSEEEDYGSA
jgi:hypothetical protein